MPESQDICSLCGKHNNQLLMLNCPHDPCIECATKGFAKQVYGDNLEPENYICGVCSEKTELDAQTIRELNNMAAKYVRGPLKELGGHKASPGYRKSLPREKKMTFFCKEHSQEEITYYCFVCEVCICPECAIHGDHFGHEVQLIKKAVGRVEKKYTAMLEVLNEMQGESQAQKDGYQKAIDEVKRINQEDKQAVTDEFDKLRAILNEREKELHANIDKISQANMKIIDTASGVTGKHHSQAEELKQTIEATLQKDEVLILDESKRINALKDKVLSLRQEVVAIDGQSGRANLTALQEKCKKASERIRKLGFQVQKSTLRESSLGKSSLRDSSLG